MTKGVIYSNNKAFYHLDRLEVLKNGGQCVPVVSYLILSDFCNLKCVFCPYITKPDSTKEIFRQHRLSGTRKNMSIHKFREIMKDFRELGVRAVELSGGGDPTMHPHLAEAIEIAVAEGIEVGLITNGVFLINRCSPELLMKCKWIRFSIDSSNNDNYMRVKGGHDGDFARVCATIRILNDARKSMGRSNLVIGTGFVVCADNHTEIYEASLLFKRLGADYVRITYDFSKEGRTAWSQIRDVIVPLARRAKDELQDDSFKVFNNVQVKSSELFSGVMDKQFCPNMHLRTYIGANCDVYVCCAKSSSQYGLVGNISSQSFRELWLGEAKRRFFSQFDARKCGPCPLFTKNVLVNKYLNDELSVDIPKECSPHANFI